MIRVYPNKLTLDLDGLCDEYTINRRTTIAKWLDETLEAGYTPGDFMPVSFTVDGEIVYESEWPEFVIRPKDNVVVCIEPRGTDPFSITIALFAGVKAVFGMLMPKLPGTPNSPGQGETLASGSAKGNKTLCHLWCRNIEPAVAQECDIQCVNSLAWAR